MPDGSGNPPYSFAMTNMSVSQTSHPRWAIGGVLLIVAAPLPLLQQFAGTIAWAASALLPSVLFAVAITLFATPRGRGGIAGSSVIGTAALLTVAWLQLLVFPVMLILWGQFTWLFPLGQVIVVVAAAVAAVAIVRARVVPAPWQWAPAIGFTLLFVPPAIAELPGMLNSSVYGSLTDANRVIGMVVVFGLGVSAIMAARAASVRVSEPMASPEHALSARRNG